MSVAPACDAAAEWIRRTVFASTDEIVALFEELLALPPGALAAKATSCLKKPYGENHLISTGRDFGISFLRMDPGQSTSLHYHERRRELFCIRAGLLRLHGGEGFRTLKAGDIGVSVPGVAHALANVGDVPLEVLELFSPPLVDDKVRVADRYGRALGQVGFGE